MQDPDYFDEHPFDLPLAILAAVVITYIILTAAPLPWGMFGRIV